MITLALLLSLVAGTSWPGVWPPCPTEDSVACYWDAGTAGNGHGRSFVALPDGTVVYLDSPAMT
jgi:hypothetical protein